MKIRIIIACGLMLGAVSLHAQEGLSPADMKLFEAVKKGDLEQIKQSIAQGAKVNATDEQERTPLMFVIAGLEHLIGENPPETTETEQGRAQALKNFTQLLNVDWLNIIKLLRESGADPTLADKQGNSVISIIQAELKKAPEELQKLQQDQKMWEKEKQLLQGLFKVSVDTLKEAIKLLS